MSADWLAAAVLVALPWSTSATGILITAFLVAVVLTLDRRDLVEHLARPAAYLPLVLWALLCAGMLWAQVPWGERWEGLKHFHKLLAFPLLLIHFSRSERSPWILAAFVVSSICLLLYSWASFWWPGLVWGARSRGLPVKDPIYQSIFFVLTASGLIYFLIRFAQQRRYVASVFDLIIILMLLGNVAYVVTSRTALIALLVLLLLIGYGQFGKKGIIFVLAASVLFGSLAWTTSTNLRQRIEVLAEQVLRYESGSLESTARRLDYWRGSLRSISEAPLMGLGTGHIRNALVAGVQADQAWLVGDRNPHNQTFAVGIQLGLVGIFTLYLMWFSHLLLFPGHGWAERLGLMVVVQNVVTCLFNSHLSDFTAGWLYLFGVGILGGMALKGQARMGCQTQGAGSSAVAGRQLRAVADG